MREAVADYVKGGNIRAIGDFIEEAASLLPEIRVRLLDAWRE
jgi:hypothetical protein